MQRAHEVKERGLPRAGRPGHGQELPLHNHEIHPPQGPKRGRAHRVVLHHAPELKKRAHGLVGGAKPGIAGGFPGWVGCAVAAEVASMREGLSKITSPS